MVDFPDLDNEAKGVETVGDNENVEELEQNTEAADDSGDDDLKKSFQQIEQEVLNNAAHPTEAKENDPDDVLINDGSAGQHNSQADTNAATPPVSGEMRKYNAKVVVNGFNDLQKTIFDVSYDLRTATHYDRAKADISQLMDKVQLEGTLTPHERQVMSYARLYIENYEAAKKAYEANSGFDEETQKELTKYADVYMKETGKDIPAWLAVLMIVGRQLSSNLLGVIIPPAPYSPPIPPNE